MKRAIFAAAATLTMAVGFSPAWADSAGVGFSSGNTSVAKTGAEVYATVCQACHMDKGQGAEGAGKYPALAKNENLEEPSYPITLILHGQKAMPPFGDMLDDKQIAEVVQYIRTNFGNDYKEPVTEEAVKEAR